MKNFDFLLGAVLGVIGVGISTLIFLTIFHWNSLEINVESWEAARILVPSIITVIGWLIAIKWALKQLEISHRNNRKVQREMAENNDKLTVINETAASLKYAAIISHNLSISIYSLKSAMEKSSNKSDMKAHLITAQKLQREILDKWHEVFIQTELLRFHEVYIDADSTSKCITA